MSQINQPAGVKNHDELTGVSAGDHHGAADHESGGVLEMLLGNMAGSLGIGQLADGAKQAMQTAVIPTTTLADTEFISFRVNVPLGSTIYIWSVGVQNDANNAPAGLTAEVDDETNAVNLVSQNAKRATGAPLTSKAGAIDVAFRIENDTGAEQNATGTFAYTIE